MVTRILTLTFLLALFCLPAAAQDKSVISGDEDTIMADEGNAAAAGNDTQAAPADEPAGESGAPSQEPGVWFVLDAGGDAQYAVLGGDGGSLLPGMSLKADGTQLATEDGYARLYNEQIGALYVEADSRVELGPKVIVYRGVAHMNSATGRRFPFGIPRVAPMSDMRGGAAVIERDVSMFCLHPASNANTLSEESAAMFESVDDYSCWQMKDGLWEPVTPPEAVRDSQRRFNAQALDSIAVNFERLPEMKDEGGYEEKRGGAEQIGGGASSGETTGGGGQSMCLDSNSGGSAGDINNGGSDVSIERGKTRVNVKVKLEE